MSEPRFPLSAKLHRGRVRHMARYVTDDVVATLCGKRGRPAPTAAYLPLCAACAAKPNPQDCRSYPPDLDTGMDEFEAADDIYRRWE